MSKRLHGTALLVALAACGGGGGGGGPGGGGPPPPAFAVAVTTQLAIATGFSGAARLGSGLVAAVSEVEAAADLNGDGDAQDRVLHFVDTATDEIRNLGFATTGTALASGRHFAFLVHEAAQGQGSLNGDADTADAVWHMYDPALPLGPTNPTNVGIATPSTGSPGAATQGGFILLESEAASGGDLTGDGDLADLVVVAVDGFSLGVLPQAPLSHAAGTPLRARSGRIVFVVSEAASGIDFNVDGDVTDNLLHIADFTQGFPSVLPVGVPAPRAVANHPFALTDDLLVYMIDEASDGSADLNGDGDTADAILAVYDPFTGTESLVTDPAISPTGIAVDPSVGIGAGPHRFVVGIDERAQGQTDLNFDIDFFDTVVGWMDTRNPFNDLNSVTGFTLASVTPLVDGEVALVSINERDMSFTQGVDLNGDGDDADNVAFRLDMQGAPGTMTNLGMAAATLALSGDDALVGVPEAGQGAGDLNGNGVLGDVVQFYFDLGDPTPSVLGLALVAQAVTLSRFADDEVRIAALVPEDSLLTTFRDLNGDGDSDDSAVLVLRIDPSQTPVVRRTPVPFFTAGTGSLFITAPLQTGTAAFAFPVSETMAGADLNGDGDSTDTVLGYVRIN